MIDNWFPTTVYYSDNNQIDLLDTYKTNCLEILNNIEGESHPFGEASLKTTFWHHREFSLIKSRLRNRCTSCTD
jgi:hypothetical protein